MRIDWCERRARREVRARKKKENRNADNEGRRSVRRTNSGRHIVRRNEKSERKKQPEKESHLFSPSVPWRAILHFSISSSSWICFRSRVSLYNISPLSLVLHTKYYRETKFTVSHENTVFSWSHDKPSWRAMNEIYPPRRNSYKIYFSATKDSFLSITPIALNSLLFYICVSRFHPRRYDSNLNIEKIDINVLCNLWTAVHKTHLTKCHYCIVKSIKTHKYVCTFNHLMKIWLKSSMFLV